MLGSGRRVKRVLVLSRLPVIFACWSSGGFGRGPAPRFWLFWLVRAMLSESGTRSVLCL